MKKIGKLTALALGLALVAGLLHTPVKAEAATPTTWYVTYDYLTDNYYFTDAPKSNNWSSADGLDGAFKEGDTIVVDGDGRNPGQKSIKVTKTVGELAFSNTANVVVRAPRVNKTYAVVGATGIVNADFVDEANAYPGATLQINGNVGTLVADYSKDPTPVFGVSGTVDVATVKTQEHYYSPVTVYSIAKGACVVDNLGRITAKTSQYSETPGASSAPAATAPAASTEASNGKVLDSVPKTGALQISESAIFFLLAAMFALGAVVYKKKVTR